MNRFFMFIALVVAIAVSSCAYDDTEVWDTLNDHESRITKLEELCQQMNTNISSLKAIVNALQNNDYVTGVTPITENGKTIGYTITFAKAQSITIYHGKDGKDGQNGTDGKDGVDGKDGSTPIIGVKQDSDGIYYWTLNGEWLLDANGNKIKVQGLDGKDGITPLLKIENNYWYISYDNGASWTQLGKATGEDGDSFFQDVTQDESNVYFTLADGTVITVPKGLAFGIEFAESDLVVMSPNSSREIGYTVTSATDTVKVEVISSADIKAKVVADDASNLTGKINITTGTVIDEYSKVVVFVSNGTKVIMRSITFEEAGLVVEENATKQASAEGGEVTLEFLSNVECEVIIPEDAQSWISVVPATRALEKQTITLQLEPNEGYYRSATVTVQSLDGKLTLDYQIEQEGDLGVEIDPNAVPDNEIWYVTIDEQIISFNEYADLTGFGANIESHTYARGKGVIKFDGDIKAIPEWSFGHCNTIISLYMPLNGTIETIGRNAFFSTTELKAIRIPETVSKIYTDAFVSSGIESIDFGNNVPELESGGRAIGCLENIKYIYGEYASEDNRCLIKDGELLLFAANGLIEYSIPQSVISIGRSAFWNANHLETITIPNTVKVIGDSCFHNCTALRNVNLSEGLEIIDSQAFMYCPVLSNIVIPNSVKQINDCAFHYCNIESVTIGTGLTQLASVGTNLVGLNPLAFAETSVDVFYGNLTHENKFIYGFYSVPFWLTFDNFLCGYTNGDGLTEVVIPDEIDGIGSSTFAGNENLNTITISPNVKYISSSAFEYCINLEFIFGEGASDDHKCYIIDEALCLFAEKNIKEYTTPESAKYISSSTFQSKAHIEKITFSDKVIEVGWSQIWRCSNLKTITYSAATEMLYRDAFFTGYNVLESAYVRALVPPTISQNGHDGIDDNVTIYVPKQSLQAYLDSPDWAPYRGFIKGYNYTDLPENDTYISTDYSQNGVATTLQAATKGEGIDIVLMGDAYSDRQIANGTYQTDMEYIYNNLFTEEPYKSLKDYFNVYYVNVVSATEGYEHSGAALRGYFGGGTLVGGNDNAVFDYALNAISEDEMDEALLIVAMNSDNYAGTCYMYYPTYTTGTYGSGPSVAYFPKGGDATTFAQLLHHEACGHGFAKLADEYAYEGMGAVPSDYVSQIQSQQNSWGWWKNVDFTNDPTATRWSHFINDTRYANEGLGAYEGGLTYWSGVWRPSENSIMRYNTGGFNAPSREAIYYRIHKLAYGDSWQYDYEEFVEWDARNRAAAAARAMVYKPTNYKPTHPPVIVNKSWKDAK